MRKAPSVALNLLLVASLSLSLLTMLPIRAAALPATSLAATPNTVTTSASLTALDFPMAGAETSARAAQPQAGTCNDNRTLIANVVALDQPFYYNRLGSIQANGMIYALRRDVVDNNGLTEAEEGTLVAGQVSLRQDKRPRPLVLRMNEGDCLEINFQNLLDPNPFIFNLNPDAATLSGGTFAFPNGPVNNQVDDQPLTRAASVHVDGLYLVGSISSDGSNVGQNGPAGDGLVDPGQSTTYTYYAANEGTHLLYSMGTTLGGEGNGGTRSFGLFGAVNVQKTGAEWYRSQLTRQEMDWATTGFTAGRDGISGTDDDQPILNYDAVYPVGTGDGKDELPIIAMLQGNEIVHSDINAIITGPGKGRFPGGTYPANRAAGDRDAPYREFTVIFHDEAFGVQAFPSFYADPVLKHTLHSVRDSFPINYGSGGIGSEIIANRLGVGPMWDCTECKYEEFFLTSFTVGDPAMIVDIPANADLDSDGMPDPGAKATKALYPDDPSNVHHSYLNDRVKFRNLHAGPKEHHVFHLHAHQWLFNPDDPQSNYLDGQAIGPGSGYSYEIAYGGSGNRNKTAGDSIFHCHFYPHFAQGMWELWRVHDVFEQGTLLDANGRPEAGSRALPDGEIVAGTPIPGVVPIPTIAMAPMPNPDATIVASDLNPSVFTDQDGDGVAESPFDSSQFDANGDEIADIWQITDADNNGVGDPLAGLDSNPGYPWFTPGLVGHRPATPALDLLDDGGLPRHVVSSGPDEDNPDHDPPPVEQYQTRLDFNKILHEASAIQIPEGGTAAERTAMAFHAQRFHPSFKADGTPADFETNGLPAVAGAPFADPCRTDDGDLITKNRTIKGANIEMAVTLNKVGWHFQQQRFEALWDDVIPTLTGARAPQPMIMRLNSTDCAEFWHTNLVPNVYQLDDYQVRTPTDIIGQHIHLVKFDVMSADGSANGWNYEDGTLSPDEVRERIDAFNNGGGLRQLDGNVTTSLSPEAHAFFGPTGPDDQNWLGARTTIQRWYADPLLERSWDGGVGTVFTHDHYGPSTHQQVGLYSTLLVEPEGSVWRHNETGTQLGTRHDGGPSGWQAIIQPGDTGVDFEPHREFYFEFADFQHAYEAGGGALGSTDNGVGIEIPSYADFSNAINPSYRLVPPNPADIFYHPNACPGPGVGQVGLPRPCPEAISADDPGTYALNFRNEPIGLRVFNGQLGARAGQTRGDGGDLAFAYQSRTDRGIAALNSQPATTYPPLTADVQPGDPWTPMLRVYMGDKVRIRVQVGAHEEEHNFTIPGLKWKQEPNSENSGWKNSEFFGIDEYFNLDVPIIPDASSGVPAQVDYIYTVGAELEGMWNGVWGILRSYGRERNDLYELPGNNVGRNGYTIANEADFNGICPIDAPVQTFDITAVRARDVLNQNGMPRQPGEDPGWLVYNSRDTIVAAAQNGTGGQGPLIDPTALLYVLSEDLVYAADEVTPVGLQPGTPVEPLILRANAGDCIEVNLANALPPDLSATEMPGFNALPPIVHKDENADGAGGITSFNANDLTPSSYVGLTPQLLAFDPRTSGGFSTGLTTGKLVAPGERARYTWYAGDVTASNGGVQRNRTTFTLEANPVEFGAIGLMPADRIKGSENALVGAMVIEPRGATWVEDPGTRAQATVTRADGSQYRDFVTVLQNDVNLRYGGGPCALDSSPISCAVPNIAAEGPAGLPEDPQDSGQKAINYGADPLWFRLGIAPNTKFETIHRLPGLVNKIRDVFSNLLVGVGGDPQTEVYKASPDGPQEGRFRVVMPGGHARGITYTLHGHEWQRQPYVKNSSELGNNPISEYYGAQEGINPTGHWDFIVNLGGYFDVVGDYLFRDQASFGSYQGLWGILRFNGTAPVAADDEVTTEFGLPVTIDVLANDLILDGLSTIAIATDPANGTATVNPDNTITYAPNTASAGSETFTYEICDQAAGSEPASQCDTATVTVASTGQGVNIPPLAADAIASTAGGTPVDVTLAATDVEQCELTFSVATAPTSGTLSTLTDEPCVNAIPSSDTALVTYTPDAGFSGVDSFTYIANDGRADSNEARITVTVNNAPEAVDDVAATLQDVPVTIEVLANDTDDGSLNPTTVLVVADPAPGTVLVNPDGTVTYTPAAGFTGTDTFRYTVQDDLGATSNEATVTVTVSQNQAPQANDDAAATLQDVPVTIEVLANDTDDGSLDPTTVLVVADPAPGTVLVNPDGTVTYTPAAGITGIDTFRYTVQDDLGATSNEATVTVTVSQNQAPQANDDAAATLQDVPVTIDVLANDADPDGSLNPTTVLVVADPAPGTVLVNPDGTVTYTPAAGFTGTDTFRYTVQDDLGATSNEATVTVTVSQNQAPQANDDAATTPQDAPVGIDVLANDADPDGSLDPTTVLVVADPVAGTVLASPNGTVTYTPAAGITGTDTFRYTVQDDLGATSNEATVTVTVTDLVSVTKVDFNSNSSRWNIQGTGSVPGVTITIYLNGDTGLVVGSAVVAADSSWRFAGESPNGVTAADGDAIAIASDAGGTVTVPVDVK